MNTLPDLVEAVDARLAAALEERFEFRRGGPSTSVGIGQEYRAVDVEK